MTRTTIVHRLAAAAVAIGYAVLGVTILLEGTGEGHYDAPFEYVIGKRDMKNNAALPRIEVDPETYEVRADGALLTCEPAAVLPMAQRYFLF